MITDIEEIIQTLFVISKTSIELSQDILTNSQDYFAKHKAAAIKAKSEDTVRLLTALEVEIKKMQEDD